MEERRQDGVHRFPIFDWRGLLAKREEGTRMHMLKLHANTDQGASKPEQPAGADGPFPFPTRRLNPPAFKPRLVTDSISNVEAALAAVERNFARLRELAEDDDRPRAA